MSELVKTQAILVTELREKLSETETKLQALSKTTGENKDGIAGITTDVSNLKTETSKGIASQTKCRHRFLKIIIVSPPWYPAL